MRLIGTDTILSLPTEQDVDTITAWENDPEHWLVSDTLAPYSREQILDFVQNNADLYQSGQLRLMIRSSVGDDRIGCIDLYGFDPKNKRVGIGILVDASYRGRGLAREALALLVDYCKDDLEMHSVYAEVLSNNPSSQHLFESVGFEQTGVRKEWLYDGNQFIDQLFYQKLFEA
jgi:diamine N-acetyltransferase